ncbi:LysR family transcriptional regulator [Labrys sp. 22185]|uniref:LysR family transcriptional regulator n=1 Tax=Labrys sp. 22185 TaxID=3453888 RepID=UPI003F83051E
MIAGELLSASRIFAQAARSESFASAGEQLDLTGSAVSKAVARLEQRLGVRLFRRTTRRLSLTEEGQLYLDACMRAFGELDLAEGLLSSRRREPTGRLRLSVPELLGRRVVMPVIQDVARRHSGIEIEVGFTNHLIDLVEDHVDIAVRIGQPGRPADLVSRRLGEQRIVTCAAPSYLRDHGTPAHPEDLAAHACIGYVRGGKPQGWQLRAINGTVLSLAVAGRLSIGSYEAIAETALAGFGVAQVPAWLVAEAIQNGSLVVVLGQYAPDSLPIYAVWPHRRDLSLRARVMIDALVGHFQGFG